MNKAYEHLLTLVGVGDIIPMPYRKLAEVLGISTYKAQMQLVALQEAKRKKNENAF